MKYKQATWSVARVQVGRNAVTELLYSIHVQHSRSASSSKVGVALGGQS